MGFDGFIDIITRVVKKKDINNTTTEYFETIGEFGEFAIQKKGEDLSLELEEIITKIGGNMPITANALALLGPSVHCLGSLGFPDVHPLFHQMSSNCKLHSFAEPGVSKILEFKDGKIMLANMDKLNKLEWDTIKEIINVPATITKFTEADLVALLNWSELDNSSPIWKGLLNDILPLVKPTGKKPIGFFDLSDCSKRPAEAVREATKLIRSFSNYWDVVLSLNSNEAKTIYQYFFNGNETSIRTIGAMLYQELAVETLIIHFSRKAICWTKGLEFEKESLFIENPAISTGAGDNFNAGFCSGKLMGFDPGLSLTMGHATSHFYMQSGYSPTVENLISHFEKRIMNAGAREFMDS